MSPYIDPEEKAKYNREYRKINRDKLIEASRVYYINNKVRLLQYKADKSKDPSEQERVRIYKKQYAIDHKSEINVKVKKWYWANREKALARSQAWAEENRDKTRAYTKKSRVKARALVFSHYGLKCTCCGESIFEFLTIDHINGGGNIHRSSLKMKGGHHFYSWLVRSNYPKEYQTLCFNCNQAKGFFGYCPHKPTQTMPL